MLAKYFPCGSLFGLQDEHFGDELFYLWIDIVFELYLTCLYVMLEVL
jgi:hypothetical protein